MRRSPSRVRGVRRMAGIVAAAITAVASVGATGTARAQSALEPGWLTVVNAYRTGSGLPAVGEDAALVPGVVNHVRYLLMTGSFAHGEDPASPFATPDGASAAAASVLGGWRGAAHTDRELIEGWMTAPFHTLHVLEPRWQRGAYASAAGADGAALTAAAVLDVVHGIGPRVVALAPITFPGNGSTVPLTSFVTEYPDPLTACPGYRAPAGLPLIAMFSTPPGTSTSSITTASGAALEHCRIDTTYTNADGGAERVGRQLLAQKNAVVLIPRAPLVAGTTYKATVSSQAGTVTWSFTVSSPGSDLPTPASDAVPLRAATKAKAPVPAKK